MTKITEDVRAAAAELLDAVRDIPEWVDEPTPEQQEWWHRKNEGGGCSYPECTGPRCYCDPDTDEAMQRRGPRSDQHPYYRARVVHSRYAPELDSASLELRELLSNPWMPEASRRRLIEVLKALAAGKAPPGSAGASDVLADPKALAVLRALETPAGTWKEVAARTYRSTGRAVSLGRVRQLSKALQNAGLIERVDGRWNRTERGTAALADADGKGG